MSRSWKDDGVTTINKHLSKDKKDTKKYTPVVNGCTLLKEILLYKFYIKTA